MQFRVLLQELRGRRLQVFEEVAPVPLVLFAFSAFFHNVKLVQKLYRATPLSNLMELQ